MEYSMWNAAVATLQFWIADLEPNILSSAIEWVYTAFFSTTPMHLLSNQPDEVLFSQFMPMLSDAFEREPFLADEGYESGSETSKPAHFSKKNFQNSSCFQWWKHLLQSFYSTHHSYQAVK